MSTQDAWPPDSDKLTADIIAMAKAPVQLPDCFVEWLRTYWMDNSAEEAHHLWSESARLGFWICTDCLRGLDKVLAGPPDDLVELMQENGWSCFATGAALGGVHTTTTRTSPGSRTSATSSNGS